MFMKKAIPILLALLSPALLFAQETGEGGLIVGGNVTIIGERGIVLPPASKPEVIDTALYMLPAGDTLIYGERITNLQGDGGPLPVYGEFDDPLTLNAEASVGTYLSPYGRVAVEYAVERWNARGLLDLRSTAGHVDGAEANGLLIGGNIEYQIPGQLPSPGKARVSGGFDYSTEDYTLYGNALAPVDRSRSIFDFDLRLTSETDVAFDYAIDLSIESVSLDDDTLGGVSALTPEFGARFRLGNDSLGIGAGIRYQSTSLDYNVATDNPEFVEASGQIEWSPAPGLFVTAGGFFANGTYSDSGSTTLVMPRGAVRYDMSRTFAIFGRFAPELRAPSYRSRVTSAPYVDRHIALRPEKVPFHLAGGVRIDLGTIGVEGEAFYETASNTPAVTVAGTPGELAFVHTDSKTLGVRGNVRSQLSSRIGLTGDLMVANAIDDSTDRQLPMRPKLELGGRLDIGLTDKFDVFGALRFRSEQNVASNVALLPAGAEETLENQLLLGAGGTYTVIDDVQIFTEITNLLSQGYHWWQNYEAPGFELRLGARASF